MNPRIAAYFALAYRLSWSVGVIAAAIIIANRFGPESFSHREQQMLH